MKNSSDLTSILLYEDNQDDAELVRLALGNSSLSFEIAEVNSKEDFHKLDFTHFDIVLLDYNLGDYDGMSAVRWIRKTDNLTPIILVSGTLDESLVVELLKVGATDFVNKSYLSRLPLVTLRALKEYETAKVKFKFQQEIVKKNLILDTIFDNLRDGIYLKDRSLKYLKINKANCNFLGKNESEIIGKTDSEVLNKEFVKGAIADDEKIVRTGLPSTYNIQKIDKHGYLLHLEIIKYPIFEGDQVSGILGTIRDITEQKNILSELRKSQTILNQAENISNTGSFEYDAEADLLTCSINMLKLLNIKTEGNTMSMRRFIRSIGLSEKRELEDAFYDAIEKNAEFTTTLKIGAGTKAQSFGLWLKPDSSDKNEKFYGTVNLEA